jgi:hypothetical protein
VTTRQPLAQHPGHGPEPGFQCVVPGQPGGGEQAGDLVEDAEVLGDRAAVRIEVDQRRVGPAAGELGGDRRRDRRTPRGSGRSPDRDDPADSDRRECVAGVLVLGYAGAQVTVGLHQVRDGTGVVGRREGGDADPGGAGPRRLRGTSADDADHPHLMTSEQISRGPVEPRRVERDHGGVGLAGAARRQQVVDVDTAPQHDHPRPAAEHLEQRELPCGSGGDHQDDDHAQPLPTTVSAGWSTEASIRKNVWASAPVIARTSIRSLPVPSSWSTGGASSTWTPETTGRPVHTGEPWQPAREDGRR